MLHITLLYAGLLGLLFLALSVWVISRRFKFRVSLGEGESPELRAAVRAHGNFAEYVPLVLLLMGGLELVGAGVPWLHLIGGLLLLGRLSHAIGIQIPKAPNPYRLVGIMATFIALLLGSLLALVHAF